MDIIEKIKIGKNLSPDEALLQFNDIVGNEWYTFMMNFERYIAEADPKKKQEWETKLNSLKSSFIRKLEKYKKSESGSKYQGIIEPLLESIEKFENLDKIDSELVRKIDSLMNDLRL